MRELATGGHVVSPKRLAEAAKAAAEAQRMDWRLHQQMAALPLEGATPVEDWVGDEDPWVMMLDDWRGQQLLTDPDEWGFADGSRHPRKGTVGAAVVCMKPVEGTEGGKDWHRAGEEVRTRRLPMPEMLGAKTTTIYDAEVAGLLDIICRQGCDARAPAVSDSQNTVDLVGRGSEARMRDRMRGANIPLESRIRRRMRKMQELGPAPGSTRPASAASASSAARFLSAMRCISAR